MKHSNAHRMAFGGVMAALAVVIMCLGGLIPVATFVCPMLCMMILQMVLRSCGSRTAWAWYGAVTFLVLLMGPDKEAAAIFAALGYYPIVKPRLDAMKWGLLWKTALFNGVILAMYALLIHLFGMDQLASEFSQLGIAMTVVTLILGNITFFLLDRVLGKKFVKRK